MPELTHTVAFHVPSKSVVCSCGDYFQSEPIGMTWFSDPVAAWARHLRETVEHNITDAYEAGWRDACDDHLRQRTDPEWPIGWGKRDRYPDPARVGDEFTANPPGATGAAAVGGGEAR